LFTFLLSVSSKLTKVLLAVACAVAVIAANLSSSSLLYIFD